MALWQTLVKRAGPNCISTGHSLEQCQNISDGIKATFSTNRDQKNVKGISLIDTDGIHSIV